MNEGPGLLGTFLGVLAALAFVLVLAWAVLRLLRRWQDRAPAADADGQLRFVRALALGPRERAVLIETRGERLLLGVTAGGISLLARWAVAPGAMAAPEDAGGDAT
jgi:flagellar protein FliO/FliZ